MNDVLCRKKLSIFTLYHNVIWGMKYERNNKSVKKIVVINSVLLLKPLSKNRTCNPPQNLEHFSYFFSACVSEVFWFSTFGFYVESSHEQDPSDPSGPSGSEARSFFLNGYRRTIKETICLGTEYLLIPLER